MQSRGRSSGAQSSSSARNESADGPQLRYSITPLLHYSTTPIRWPRATHCFPLSVLCLLLCTGAGFFSNPERVANLCPDWERSEIGVVWSDNFNRASLGPNWVILGGANATISGNQL